MHCYSKLVVLVCIVLSVIGCSKDKPQEPPSDLIYPLQVGNRWEFTCVSYSFDFRPFDSATPTPDLDTISSTSVIEIVALDTLADSTVAFRAVEVTTYGSGDVFESTRWLVNRADGLYAIPGPGNPQAMPAPYHFHRLIDYENRRAIPAAGGIWGGLLSSGISAVSQLQAFKYLSYPLEVGQQWTYLQQDESPYFLIDLAIVGTEHVRIPAGKFPSFVIQHLVDAGSDGTWDSQVEWYDFVSESGLVKRSILFRDVTLTTYMYPEGIGVADNLEVLELQRVELQ